MPRVMTTPQVSIPVYPGSYLPQTLQTAYDVALYAPPARRLRLPSLPQVYVTGVISDLRLSVEEKPNPLPQVTVKVETVGLASTDTSGADEFDMDTQYSSGMAQHRFELLQHLRRNIL